MSDANSEPVCAPNDFAALMLECYRRTDNPLYAWDALAFHGMVEPLPPELAAYLMRVALDLGRIGMAVRNREIEPTEAAGLAATALGIVAGNNYNAFAAEEHDNEAAWTASFHAFHGGGADATAKLAAKMKPNTAKQLEAAKKKIRRQLERSRYAGRTIED